MKILVAFALLLATAGNAEPAIPSSHIQKMIAKSDDLTPATAFKVSSVREEYEIAQALGLKIESQSLIIQKKPYDMLKATDATGHTREVWFDISSFYPEF